MVLVLLQKVCESSQMRIQYFSKALVLLLLRKYFKKQSTECLALFEGYRLGSLEKICEKAFE